MGHYGQLIYLFTPVILAGICNMVFVKLPVLGFLRTPMDAGLTLPDGRRLFGANKTWKGFGGMIALSVLFTVLQAYLAQSVPALGSMTLMSFEEHGWILPGLAMGLGYALAELPNSLIKRRFDVPPGENVSGLRGFLFGVFDQADSVIGCLIGIALLHPFTVGDALFLLLFGTGLHYFINVLLYLVGLKSQPA